MPLHVSVNLLRLDGIELHAQHFSINLQNGGHDFVDREIFLDLLIICSSATLLERRTQRQLALSPKTVVISVIPEVERVIHRQSSALVDLFLQCEELGPLREAQRCQLFQKIVEESIDRLGVFGHLDVKNEVCIGFKVEDVGHLTTKLHNLVQDRYIAKSLALVAELGLSTGLRDVCVLAEDQIMDEALRTRWGICQESDSQLWGGDLPHLVGHAILDTLFWISVDDSFWQTIQFLSRLDGRSALDLRLTSLVNSSDPFSSLQAFWKSMERSAILFWIARSFSRLSASRPRPLRLRSRITRSRIRCSSALSLMPLTFVWASASRMAW